MSLGRLFSVVVLVTLTHAGGCAIRTPAAPERGSAPAGMFDGAFFPARWNGDLDALAERLPQTVHIYVPQFEKQDDGQWEMIARARATPMWHFAAREAHGCGLVVEVVRAGEPVPEGVELTTFLAILREESERQVMEARAVRVRNLRFLHWHDAPCQESLVSDDAADWMRYAAGILILPQDQDPIGLAIFAGGGMEYDWHLRWRMIDRGWAVLNLGLASTVDSQPIAQFMLAAVDESNRDTIAEAAATLEQLGIHVGDMPATAAAMARTVDHYIADSVYAAEAFLNYARTHERALRDVPIVIVGLSRGAFIVPALAARLVDEPAAAVLVTGGADIADIALRTSLTNQSWLRLSAIDARGNERRLTAAQRSDLIRAYRHVGGLDPYNTATALHGIPTLMIHGMFDRIVPASAGRVLYERLARPERWSYPLGHGGVFWLLPREADRIIDWIEAAAGE